MRTLLQDLQYGVRGYLRSPGLTLTALLALAVGVGANSAIFSVVNAVLLRPLPYDSPDGLVMIWETNRQQGRESERPSPGNFLDWRAGARAFERVAAWTTGPRTLRTESGAEEITVARVTVGSPGTELEFAL